VICRKAKKGGGSGHYRVQPQLVQLHARERRGTEVDGACLSKVGHQGTSSPVSDAVSRGRGLFVNHGWDSVLPPETLECEVVGRRSPECTVARLSPGHGAVLLRVAREAHSRNGETCPAHAEKTSCLDLRKSGVDGFHQPFTGVGRILLHTQCLPSSNSSASNWNSILN